MVDMRSGGGDASTSKAVNQSNAEAARGDEGAQTSAIKSSNASEDTPPPKAPSKASSRRNSTQAAASSDLRQPAHMANGTSSAPEQAAQSQPMTATTSDSSHASAKESKEPVVAPYGTRSRNRPGTSRPNYAEDVELDFEVAQTASNGNTSEPSSRGSVATESGQSSGVGGKKGSGAGRGNAPWGNTGPNSKDQPPNLNIPGTSTFAANPTVNSTQPQPKRRKNAASHAVNGSHANAAAPSQVGSRRANNALIAANSTRETNMMTFEKTGAMLKNGRLETDDGQTVSVDGMCSVSFPFSARPVSLRQPHRAFLFSVSNWTSRPSLSRLRAARGALLFVQNHGVPARRW